MTVKSPRERKKQLKKAFKDAARDAELGSSPLPLSELRELVDTVSRLVFDESGRVLCEHTHRLTRSYLEARCATNIERVVAFLCSKGGRCDCEVALNLASWLAWNAPIEKVRH